MQILLYVLTMLLLLTALAYVRLDSYRNFSAIRAQFEKFMTKNEREYYSRRATTWYNNTVVTTKDKENQEREQKIQASSRLSLYPLIDKKTRESDSEEQARFGQIKSVLKKLMDLVYGKVKFYQEMEQKNPDFADTIIEGIIQASEKMSGDQKITSAADLANLNLGNAQLNEAFYKMLKGATPDDEETPGGYPSLLDFINVSPKTKLRVYLAPKMVLLAMSGDEGVVTQILTTRKQIHSQVIAEPPRDVKEAEKEFKSLFQGSFSSVNDALLDYSITKTNPAEYE